jgi:hypothetical protein
MMMPREVRRALGLPELPPPEERVRLGLRERARLDAAVIHAPLAPEALAAWRAAIELLPAGERPKYRRILAEMFPEAK